MVILGFLLQNWQFWVKDLSLNSSYSRLKTGVVVCAIVAVAALIFNQMPIFLVSVLAAGACSWKACRIRSEMNEADGVKKNRPQIPPLNLSNLM